MTNPIAQLLQTRRSVLAGNMTEPGPGEEEIAWLLKCAARVPDHGRLVPWRFVLLRGHARGQVGAAMERIAAARDTLTESQARLERERFARAPLVICVVSRAGVHPKIPEWEQVLSAGAVCQTMLIGAAALGYAAQWLTEWPAYDAAAHRVLGLAAGEKIAGFVYVGTAVEAPTERPRPDMAEIVADWTAQPAVSEAS
jgi:nitroreductase